MRFYYLLGAAAIATGFLYYVYDYRENQDRVSLVLDLLSSSNPVHISRALDAMKMLMQKPERTLSGITMVRTNREILVQQGALENLIAVLSLANGVVKSDVRISAINLLLALVRDVPFARTHLVKHVGIEPIIRILEEDDSVEGNHSLHLSAAAVLVVLSGDVDAKQALMYDRGVIDFYNNKDKENHYDKYNNREKNPLATLLLARAKAHLIAGDEGAFLFGHKPSETVRELHQWEPAQLAAIDATFDVLCPDTRIKDLKSRIGAAAPDALALSLFGFLYGRLRWAIKLSRADIPEVKGRQIFHQAARKSRVGVCLFALFALDFAFSHVRQDWQTIQARFPELMSSPSSSQLQNQQQQQQENVVQRTSDGDEGDNSSNGSSKRFLGVFHLPYYVSAPILQGAFITATALLFQRRQHFLVLPIVIATAYNHFDLIEENTLYSVLVQEFNERRKAL